MVGVNLCSQNLGIEMVGGPGRGGRKAPSERSVRVPNSLVTGLHDRLQLYLGLQF